MLSPTSASFLARSNNSSYLASLYLTRFKFSFVFLARCHLFYLWFFLFFLWAYFFPTNLIRVLEFNCKSGASAPSKSKRPFRFFSGLLHRSLVRSRFFRITPIRSFYLVWVNANQIFLTPQTPLLPSRFLPPSPSLLDECYLNIFSYRNLLKIILIFHNFNYCEVRKELVISQ